MVSNTILRFTWLLKAITITSHNQHFLDIFLIGGEMFRRWVWVFLRLEREWVVIHPDGFVMPLTQQQFRVNLNDAVGEALIED